eukprot:GHUV01036786.1.p1 GENE.GHUV01036786.1~~GHUV01036786.1.p1  ORF type:complete len:245 (+),score=51.14 GHUV01036786.1:463-1197(+)
MPISIRCAAQGRYHIHATPTTSTACQLAIMSLRATFKEIKSCCPGAGIIEANYSCPNVSKGQGALYTDAGQVAALSQALVTALGREVPLIIKVGAFLSKHQLDDVLVAAAAAGVRGVAGINGLSRHIVNTDGLPALGPDRPTSGVCGAPIRQAALEFVQSAREIINRQGLGLTLIGVGGVTCAQHVDDMLDAGADIVQSATGMMWNPLLACDHHQLADREKAGVAKQKSGFDHGWLVAQAVLNS